MSCNKNLKNEADQTHKCHKLALYTFVKTVSIKQAVAKKKFNYCEIYI